MYIWQCIKLLVKQQKTKEDGGCMINFSCFTVVLTNALVVLAQFNVFHIINKTVKANSLYLTPLNRN